MNVIGVIPARWAATRFEGKLLAKAQGKFLLQHVWERAKESRQLKRIIIACDDQRIKKAAEEFGAEVILTSQKHTSGSERIAEAIADIPCAVVVNIQGDEPLIHYSIIDPLVDVLTLQKNYAMATVIKKITVLREIHDPHVVKVVVNNKKEALYFSRATIPFQRGKGAVSYYKHLGIYAYRKDFLLEWTRWPKSFLEQTEQLEQLRVLETGYKIKTIETERETIGVDTPEDLERVREILALSQ